MTVPSAKVIADSKFNETRIISLEVEMHRFILAENNTHKRQSRNIQSSRAIPVLRQLEQISNDPAMPVFYGKNESGMVAREELSPEEIEECKRIILWMRDCCVMGVKQLHSIGLAKQTANRYVEPWMWTKGVVTATETAWEAMFKLRCHYAAQPEIRVLFEEIQRAIASSTPRKLREGDMHLPYVTMLQMGEGTYYTTSDKLELSSDDLLSEAEAIKVSSSCVAQVSYRRLDDSMEKAKSVYKMLNLPEGGVYPDDPPHFSPTEHIAIASKGFKHLSGNLDTDDFVQYRRLLEEGVEKEWIMEQCMPDTIYRIPKDIMREEQE